MTTDRRTWLAFDEYLNAFTAEVDRLAEVVRSGPLEAAVPSCPGWVLLDLVRHCADVYSHKIGVLRLGRPPEAHERTLAETLPASAAVDWHDQTRAELSALLVDVGPDAPCWTWLPTERRTAFWFRRMAHEAAVHRVDAELALGRSPSPGHPQLGADGVDELLGFADDPNLWSEPGADDGKAGSVLIEAGSVAWRIELPDAGYAVRPAAPSDSADARLCGPDFAVDLHLWNRSSELTGLSIQQSGDESVLRRLRARLAATV